MSETRRPSTWQADLNHFCAELAELDSLLAAGAPLDGDMAERLLQGPVSDVMTHVGQLAMLRRLAGSPVTGENFRAADIQIGCVGPDQPLPLKPFEPRN